MKRLKKEAENAINLQVDILDQYVDLLHDKIYPIQRDFEIGGIVYGYDDTKSYIDYLMGRYEIMIEKSSQLNNTSFKRFFNQAVEICNDCINELDKWYEVYKNMPRETKDDMCEVEEYEYVADKAVLAFVNKLSDLNKDIENEIVEYKEVLRSKLN